MSKIQKMLVDDPTIEARSCQPGHSVPTDAKCGHRGLACVHAQDTGRGIGPSLDVRRAGERRRCVLDDERTCNSCIDQFSRHVDDAFNSPLSVAMVGLIAVTICRITALKLRELRRARGNLKL